MHAMQYEITLPADYDMGVIRHRVESKGHLLDAFPGLGFKAYLMRERGRDGSPVNQYAPFYLWNTPAGMHSFLWGPGFQGLVDDFGRPVVQHWSALAYEESATPTVTPRVALRHRRSIPEGTPLPGLAEELACATKELVKESDALSAVAAVDPRTWEVVHFSLWEHEVPEGRPGDVFQVLHLSTPERDRLARGRQW
ncbi:DUF4865 domain-containing protein [Streptomyces sp. WAC 01529]|uniref:DUF4865 family protein n=1 Tax=Streptomyces sp. WAC 01529 TaxID=2203205 RepID=UPI000F70A19E|nr:DUF4865 family protein [Streptomyces sp. WAC 01529]AZM51842.1 DUF4865 domain-containing protein [Streptomyces sp. WAC 01529]